MSSFSTLAPALTFWFGLMSCLLTFTASASLTASPFDLEELLFLNHANMTNAAPFQVTADLHIYPIKILGNGAFGFINLVQLQSKGMTTLKREDKFVLKKVRREKSTRSCIDMEKLALESADHPFIIQLHASFKDRFDFFFLMEQGCSPDLHDLVQRLAPFDKNIAQFYVASIMLALEHLHSRGIVHRDLKLENVVLGKDGFPRIIDFGAAKLTSDNSIDFAGTSRYFSPEMISKLPHGTGVDWWALGHAMYEMLLKRHVFREFAATDVTTAVIEFPDDLDKDAVDLIRQLLEKDPSKRLGVVDDSWKIITEHPWFAGFDWIKLLKRDMRVPIEVKFEPNEACHAIVS